MTEYISKVDFALTFEGTIDPVNVKIGEVVLFDGLQAMYTNRDGIKILGKAPSLKTAINMNWLSVKKVRLRKKPIINRSRYTLLISGE